MEVSKIQNELDQGKTHCSMGILVAGRLGAESRKRMNTHLSMSVRALLSKKGMKSSTRRLLT
jgi:hypothetical protein